MIRHIKYAGAIILSFLMISCGVKAPKSEVQVEEETVVHSEGSMAGPPVIIYKTKGDYNELVPVLLNTGGDTVLSYPHPADLFTGGELSVPQVLEDGYLLDRRGINQQVAFTNWTYTQYAAMDRPPSVEQILESITDADPLSIMYHCGSRYAFNDLIPELNAMIIKGDFSNCKRLK